MGVHRVLDIYKKIKEKPNKNELDKKTIKIYRGIEKMKNRS